MQDGQRTSLGADALLLHRWLLGAIHLRWPAFYKQVILAAVTFSDGIMCFVTINLQATIFLRNQKATVLHL